MKFAAFFSVVSLVVGVVSAATDAGVTFRDGKRNVYQGYVKILVDEAGTGFTVTNHSGSTSCIAWGQLSKKFSVPASSANWSLDFMIQADSTWYRVETCGQFWRNAVTFYGRDDTVVGQTDLEIEFPGQKPPLPFRFTGRIPEGAERATVQFGVDSKPTIKPGKTVQVSDVRFAFYGKGEKIPDWIRPDMSPPLVRSAFTSPSLDENLVIRYRLEDQSAIDWTTVSVSNLATQALVPYRREGNVIALQPGKPWPKGVTRLEIRAADTLGYETLAKKVFLIGEEKSKPFVTLRDDGVTLLREKPFYPIGIYGVSLQDFNSNSFVKAFADLKAGGLNMGQSYTSWSDPRYFKGAHASDVVSFTWGKDAVRGDKWFLETGRAEESIIAWYIGDDTSMHMKPQELLDHDEACRMLDGRRLTCQADGVGSAWVKSSLQDYVDDTDVFLAEIYPYDGTRDEQAVAEVCRAVDRCFADYRKFADPKRPHAVWAILQCFHGCSWHYYPSPAEMYASSFAAVAHGAQGMTWFMYGGGIVEGKSRYSGMFRTPETWSAMTNIMTRISQLSPVLLERTPAQPSAPKIVSGPTEDPLGKPAVTLLLKEHAGEVYVIAVNAATKPVRAQFSLPVSRGGVSVLWENRALELKDGTFEDDFPVNGVHVYKISKKRDFIEFLPSCKRHYQDPKLQARDWDRAWTIRDERFNHVTNLFLDIEHPETFPRELFDSASSAGAVRGCFGWGKNALDPRFAQDVEPNGDPNEKPAKLGVRRVEAEMRVGENRVRFDFNREQLAEIEDHISGRAPLPRGAEKQIYDGNLLIAPWEKTPFAVICRRIGAALDARARRGEDVSAFRRELDSLRLRTTESARDALDACALRRRVLFSDPALRGTGFPTRVQEEESCRGTGFPTRVQEEESCRGTGFPTRAGSASAPLIFLARATYAGSRLTNWKNSDATGGHFATQCYAFNTIRGGGLFRVDGWQDDEGGQVRNLLAGCVVTNGPLAGRTLEGELGCFYSFDLDYDGRTLYFTYARPKLHRWIWDESTTWKIFKLDIPTGKIAQLTFGNTNDFDPAVLPGGRVVFSSERRGGFIRCFTKDANLRVPVFMLHSMKPNGTDIYPISFYETSEWQASVGNDGMLVYTRWDYTDRDDCLGSRFWICYPDGRDPRAPHGNYPFPWHTFADNKHGYHVYGSCKDAESGLPMTEMGIRAIPGSHEYILTASPHHGESFGSICRLDVRIKDDHQMSQLRRLTPFVKFPESESPARSQYEYGTPWPIDDNLYFCTRWEDVVLRDRFGNEELVVAREQLPCGYDPRLRLTHARPFAARTRPPIITQQTTQGEDFVGKRRPAVVSVVDVKQSDIAFPTNRTPTRLRVLQAIVKPDPWMDIPMIGYENENCPRIPLGTVPIEPDGSCRFYCPAGKQLIFQVLDEKGAAIQSMRSTAFVHTGESLTCVGCHEPHQETATAPAKPPKAFARPPSKLEPEGIGVEPITFARLARPVFAKCQACHEKEKKGPTNFSYPALRDLTFHFNGGFGGSIMKKDTGGSRSIPGRVGTANCVLGRALLGAAHAQRVSEADRRRITLWLDANSLFYGAFYDFKSQESGERIVWPILDVDPDNPLADCE